MASGQPAEGSQPAASVETGGALESVGTFVSGFETGTGNASGQVGNGSQQGNGDLFNMPPIEPLNLAALGRGESSDVPGLRRVVVSEGSEELMPDQGALAGPVGGLAAVTPPQDDQSLTGQWVDILFLWGILLSLKVAWSFPILSIHML